MMVAPHCLQCMPHEEGGKEDLFKTESLGDLMKKHKVVHLLSLTYLVPDIPISIRTHFKRNILSLDLQAFGLQILRTQTYFLPLSLIPSHHV